MKTKIEMTFDETQRSERNIILFADELCCAVNEFETFLRDLYKYGEFESDEGLQLVEAIRDSYYNTIGEVNSKIES
jgi:hypothetical protein